MLSANDIRQQFLDFFKSKGHHIVPSAPVVIKNDPTLLFTNAGMNQFKDYFLGNKKAPYPRIADTQKCLRVSGKHNDLEEVGVDTYHHTMFEMLGNWSFGDYFKKEAVAWSWELLTEVFKIDKDRLYITVFGGDEKEHLPADKESFDEWKKWIAEDRILFGKKKDNFWEMGDIGPCGPCTEIHIDCRSDDERISVNGKTLVNEDDARVIEIWNNVFIEFNRLKDGSLEHLPARHVDTGMGLERLVCVMQNKQSNYDTDIFIGTIAATEKIAGKKYDYGDSKTAIAFRVIADHIRAIAFTIADGQLPSNTGAGYVIRRILRRAVRYYFSYLEYKQPLLYQLIPQLAKQFENIFPELQKQVEFVTKVVKEEEEAFLRTLGKGIDRFNAYTTDHDIHGYSYYADNKTEAEKISNELLEIQIQYHKERKNKKISGGFAFELNDTYGFPIDLTQLMAREKGWIVDMDEFQNQLQQQKQRSRAATAIDTEDWVVLDNYALNEFVGYDSLEIKTKVVKYRKVKAKGKELFQIVLEATPFYAESGGQVGDTGILDFAGEVIDVIDTKKENDLIIHFTETLPEKIDTEVFAKVDTRKRQSIAVHHSATHLLHAALRKVLGTHAAQKGSLVNAEHLRFDFSHFAKVSDEEIENIEALVNEKIRENISVIIHEMPKEEALQMGALALFGEKYGDTVRVVIIDKSYSVELCGGTHVCNTGELGFFQIKHETAIAAGIRRMEAVSGKAAQEFVQEKMKQLHAVQDLLKYPKDIGKAIENLITENEQSKKKIERLNSKSLYELKKQLLNNVESNGQVNQLLKIVDVDSPDSLRKLCFDVRGDLSNYFILLASKIDGKPHIIIMIDDDIANGRDLDASQIIKQHIAPLIKGGGGGQKTVAAAGGQDAGNLEKVIEKVKSLLEE